MTVMNMSYAELEQFLFKLVCETFLGVMSKVLSVRDQYLLVTRDAARYEVLGAEAREVETRFGLVRLKRRVYRDVELGKRVYLLDEQMKLKPYQRIGPGLAAAVVTQVATGASSRAAAEQVAMELGQRVISHEGVRQQVLRSGEVLERQSEAERKQVEMLFIEADGVYVGRQGKKGRKRKARKRETRAIVVHEGWRPRSPGSEEYELVNRQRFVTQDSGKTLWAQVKQKLESRYESLDETLVVINGDGASWIQAGLELFGQAIYQCDRYHVTTELQEAMRGLEQCGPALEALQDNDLKRLLAALEAGVGQSRSKQQRQLIGKVYQSMRAQWQWILDYRIRLRALGYDTAGLRGMGSAESNISKLKARVRGKSWSDRGLQAVMNVVIALTEGRLSAAVQAVTTRSQAAIETVVQDAVVRITRQAVGQPPPPVRTGGLPALQGPETGTAHLLRCIVNSGFPV